MTDPIYIRVPSKLWEATGAHGEVDEFAVAYYILSKAYSFDGKTFTSFKKSFRGMCEDLKFGHGRLEKVLKSLIEKQIVIKIPGAIPKRAASYHISCEYLVDAQGNVPHSEPLEEIKPPKQSSRQEFDEHIRDVEAYVDNRKSFDSLSLPAQWAIEKEAKGAPIHDIYKKWRAKYLENKPGKSLSGLVRDILAEGSKELGVPVAKLAPKAKPQPVSKAEFISPAIIQMPVPPHLLEIYRKNKMGGDTS